MIWSLYLINEKVWLKRKILLRIISQILFMIDKIDKFSYLYQGKNKEKKKL